MSGAMRPETGTRWSIPNMATRRVGGGINEFVVEVIDHERDRAPGYDGLVPTRIVKATHTRRRGQYGGIERGNRVGDVVWVKPTDLRRAEA